MNNRETFKVVQLMLAMSLSIIIFSCGCICGAKLEQNYGRHKENYNEKEKIDDEETTLEAEQTVEHEDEEMIIKERQKYYEEIYPIKIKGIDFFRSRKNYKINKPNKVFADYDCTSEVKDPVITSVFVLEIILNEDNVKYGLRTEDNKLVWVKEEPRIEERQ